MLMYGYVYKTTDLTNGKIYVGKHRSSNFDPRYLGSGVAIKDAIRAKGRKNFTVELLEEYKTPQDLDEGEKKYIQSLKARDRSIGYNIAEGGEGAILTGSLNGMYGRKHTTESKERMSKAIKERGSRTGANNSFYGRSHTESTKQVLRDKCRQPDEFYEEQSRKFSHDFDVNTAYELLKEGKTYKQISVIMGVPKTTVFRKLKKYTAHHSNG